ncbi:glycosyltransferase family 1 protein [Coleofasciculus sp. E1-EBD-02]|uniref:glycosyltransferase family 1 protein n=1 Tax=Coleofasciculus sp. E1-EBD-02 TaxID=3068481 RepID=UPI0032F17BDB
MSMNHQVFFYCHHCDSPQESAFQHWTLCLAEGFKALGIPFYSDKNYWQLSPDHEQYIFAYNPEVKPEDCSIVIVNHHWMDYGKGFPQNLFRPDRKYITVYVDSLYGINPDLWKPEFRQFDVILRCHFNRKIKYPYNVKPWVFGISNRILDYTDNPIKFNERKNSILWNYRVRGHSVRIMAKEKFLPSLSRIFSVDDSVDNFHAPQLSEQDALLWKQTGRRHYPNYYTRLKSSAASACFGGHLEPPIWFNYAPPYIYLHRALNKFFPQSRRMVLQWDSWRFWESLAAGCVTFHVDFEKYGIQLPVMPINYLHYIGIDLDNPEATVEKIANEPNLLEKVAVAGRTWAIEYYSPVPTAKRFLDLVNFTLAKS